MKETYKVITIETKLTVNKEVTIFFFNGTKYVIQVGSFVILKDYALTTFGVAIYKNNNYKGLMDDCFDNKKHPYKRVVPLLTDESISRILDNNCLMITDRGLHSDKPPYIPYRNILHL